MDGARAKVLDELAQAAAVAGRGSIGPGSPGPDRHVAEVVTRARRMGVFWREIGERLGLTASATRERFAPAEQFDLDSQGTGGFARITTRGRKVITATTAAARAAGSDAIAPVHLVLGLLAEPDALSARAILAQNVPLDAVRRAALAALPAAAGPSPDVMPFGPDGAAVVTLAFRAAIRLGQDYVGPEHFLLGLLEQERGHGVLSSCGVDPARTEMSILAAGAGVSG